MSNNEYPCDESHVNTLDYGRTNGINLPSMTEDKLFGVGYNSKYGLVTVCEDNGEIHFDGRVDLGDLVSKNQSKDRKTIDAEVHDLIMESYQNSIDQKSNPGKYKSGLKPIMKVLVDKTDTK